MSKRLTYREQLDRARQQAAVAALREAARLVSEGDYTAARPLMSDANETVGKLWMKALTSSPVDAGHEDDS